MLNTSEIRENKARSEILNGRPLPNTRKVLLNGLLRSLRKIAATMRKSSDMVLATVVFACFATGHALAVSRASSKSSRTSDTDQGIPVK